MWRTTRAQHALTVREKARVIEEFAGLAPRGGVVFTGGEPFKEAEELFELSDVVRRLGLQSLTNTNGSYLDARMLARAGASVPDVLVLSLDSYLERTHDFMRGMSGAYRAALDAISRLVEMRAAGGGRRPAIYVSAILCELTLDGVRDLVELTRGLGVDGITFQMLEPTFMLAGAVDRFYGEYWFRDASRAKGVLRCLAREYADDPFVLLSAQDFDWMGVYVDHPVALPYSVCASHERNVWIDMYGEAQLCAYMREITAGSSLGNVRERSLIEMLGSDFACQARAAMESCRRACGMLNCHRKS